MPKIPARWSEITIRQFQKIYPIITSEEYENNSERIIDIAAALTGGKISDISIQDINKLSFIMTLNGIPDNRPEYIQFKGRLYKPIYSINKLTGGQYIDLSTYTANNDTVIKHLHYIIAIMCEERQYIFFKKKYTPENVKARADVFLDLPISIAYPMAVFFCKYSDNLMRSMVDYLKTTTKTRMQ